MITFGVLGTAFVAIVAVALASVGGLQLYLPFPAAGFKVDNVPATALPLKPSHLEGRFAPDNVLTQAVKLLEGQVQGSESVVVHPDGSLILLDKFGYVRKAVPAEVPDDVEPQYQLIPEPIAHLGHGRPLGAALDSDLNLVICDSLKGLLKLDVSSGKLEVLTSKVGLQSALQPSTPIVYANDLDIAANGDIFFSDSQRIPVALNAYGFWDTFRSYVLGLLSGTYAGRLLKYQPSTGTTEVLVDGLWYANGVALSADESFVALVETNRLRVMRYWLKGSKAGSTDVLIDQLPAFPDGVDLAEDGSFWVSCVAPVLPVLKHPLVRLPVVRTLVAWLPDFLRPKAQTMGLVIKVSETGDVLRVLSDVNGTNIAFVSAVHEHGGRLFMGNLVQDYVSFLPASLAAQESGHSSV